MRSLSTRSSSSATSLSNARWRRRSSPAGLAEQARDVARAVVGHHALDPNALAFEPAQRADQKTGHRLAFLVGQDLDIGQARGIVDSDVDELPARAVGAVAAIARDAVADAAEAGELLDVEVDELAGACAAVTPRRLARLECGQATEPQPLEMAGDGAPRQVKPHGDLLAGHAVLATQARDHGEPGRWQLVGDQAWRRAAVLQAGMAFASEAGEPLAHGARADLERRSRPLSRSIPPRAHGAHHGSTKRRRAGILMAVHPGAPSAAGDASHPPPARLQPG
jgi:hypothetical protein